MEEGRDRRVLPRGCSHGNTALPSAGVLLCRAQGGERGKLPAPTRMSFHDESPPPLCLSCLTVLSQRTVTFVAKCLSEEIGLPLLWLFHLLGHEGPEVIVGCLKTATREAREVPLHIGSICTWSLSTERGFTAAK